MKKNMKKYSIVLDLNAGAACEENASDARRTINRDHHVALNLGSAALPAMHEEAKDAEIIRMLETAC